MVKRRFGVSARYKGTSARKKGGTPAGYVLFRDTKGTGAKKFRSLKDQKYTVKSRAVSVGKKWKRTGHL